MSHDRAGRDGFVHAVGRDLVVDGRPIRLRAVNFSNFFYADIDGSELLTSSHHSDQDFRRAKSMGFNTIRFAFDGDWYVDDRQMFWQWMDRNVSWARQHGLRLVLDLHTPIGSFWLDSTSDGVSFDLWSDAGLQQQNVDMWRDIAFRYRDEPVVAGFDLLNEPVTTDADGAQWRALAQQFVDAIRSVDEDHLLIVAGLSGVEGRYGTNGLETHFLVEDKNVMYDFHFYEPVEYTHQYAPWVGRPMQDGGSYPDPGVLYPTGEQELLSESTIPTPSLPLGTSTWTEYDSGKVTVQDGSAVAAKPVIIATGGMRGTAYFDAITVTEYGPEGNEKQVLVSDQLSAEQSLDWHPWNSGNGTAPGAHLAREASGVGDDASLSVSDVAQSDAQAGWANDRHLFKVVPGNQYRIRGYMRGRNIAPSATSVPLIRLQLDVYAESEQAGTEVLLQRNEAYLARQLQKNLQFGIDYEVPMSVMEFGVVRQTFEMEGKGGGRWVADMIDLLEANRLNYGYWEYHGADMGIYLGGPGEPSSPNTTLQVALRQKLLPWYPRDSIIGFQ